MLLSYAAAAYAESFRLYYSAFPFLSSTQVRNTIIACIRSLTGSTQEYRSCRIGSPTSETLSPNMDLYTESLDYGTVYSQKMTLSSLAKLASCSPSYLSREFKDATGTTIFEYIAHLRCMHAAEMLWDTDAPIQSVSSFVGYLDNNYFVKVFRKELGTTPSEYRMEKQLEKSKMLGGE